MHNQIIPTGHSDRTFTGIILINIISITFSHSRQREAGLAVEKVAQESVLDCLELEAIASLL